MSAPDLVLLLAVVSNGLLAGAFALYAHTVMPGLRRTDAVTFVGAFQAIDRAVINPWFIGGCFLGAPVLVAGALVLHLDGRRAPWLAVALVLLLAVVVITLRVNVPRNDAIKAAEDPTTDSAPAVRSAFDERRWARWNLVRTWCNVASLACCAYALGL